MRKSVQNSMYHRMLRVASVVCACVLVFQSGLVSQSTAQLSKNTHSYLASVVGVGASVEPTELNMYTAELTARERELDEREAALNEREIAVSLNGGSAAESTTYVLASILFILLLLILLNYILDYLRSKELQIAEAV